MLNFLSDPRMHRRACRAPLPYAAVVVAAVLLLRAGPAAAGEQLCDTAYQDCRAPLINLIRAETQEIDVSFWFMEDGRYANELVKKWQAGVLVRVMVDSRANAEHPINAQLLQELRNAGIPMREKYTGGILHRKFMLFAGQNTVEFSGANFSGSAFVPVDPYRNYVDEGIYFTDDSAVVNSFCRVMDDMWTSTSGYRNYANVSGTPSRRYPLYPIDPDLNFPPGQSYATRAVGLYNREPQRIDVQMFRITDRRHSDAMIAAFTQRHIPVRLYTDDKEYRNASRLWHAWNIDRMWLAGIPIKVPAHLGINHEKAVLLYGQGITIFGSSNWTSPSANSQAENNYFTAKTWFFQWFEKQFNRKWNNTNPTGVPETKWFVPLPPDPPSYRSIANGATGIPLTGQKLVWHGGPWAHIYDVYFGTDPTAQTLVAGGLELGPSQSATQNQSYALPALEPGVTYYWRIVSKTAALKTKTGPIWSFTTAGTASNSTCSGSSAPTVVMWAANVGTSAIHGNWTRISDSTAAGGTALRNTDRGAAKITPALASPANYFQTTFHAQSGIPYHLWIRLRAQSNSRQNDSVHAQFNDSVNAAGSAMMRIGTSGSAEIVLQAGDADSSLHNWGWADNGWNTLGPNIYFASTGTHTVRIQQREDGAIIDQIVLSPARYLCGPPGPRDNDSTILTATESGGSSASLPSPWRGADIGPVPIAGSGGYTSGTFRVTGSGADIWGTTDAFHFVYRALTGDGWIQARVATLQNVDAWTKAGVMIRETLNRQSRHAFMLVSAAKGVAFQWRPNTAGTSHNAAGSAARAPHWVRLKRSGSTITAQESSNGTSWTTVRTQTIALAASVFVGLAVTSHDTSAAATATFSNVTVGTGTPAAALTAGAYPADGTVSGMDAADVAGGV